LLSKFLTFFGFTENPFASTNADKEPKLSKYFVPPPYFTSVLGDARDPKSNLVFAPRGGGKTAQKVMLEERASSAEGTAFLAITYDSFRSLPKKRASSASIEWHLTQVIERLLIGALALIGERKLQLLNSNEKKILSYAIDKYLGSLSAAEAAITFNAVKTNFDHASEFISKHKSNIVKLVSAIPMLFGLSPLELEAGKSELKDESPIWVIEKLIEIIRKSGVESIYILVDRIDEVTEFSNDAAACAKFIHPLLSDLSLLELDGLAFKIFLWDQLEEELTQLGMRSDRVLVHRLSWTPKNLSEMLSKRLATYSGEKVNDLNSLTAPDVEIDLQKLVCVLGNGSPRDVIRLINRIIDEHTRAGDTTELISWHAIENGTKNYCKERSIELYGIDRVSELNKIGLASFTIGQIASDVFRISNQAARQKIQNLMNVGAIVKSGEIENPPNRPLHQYSIVDPRLAFDVLSDYSLKSFLEFFVFNCPRCDEILVRETEEVQCHACSLEFNVDDSENVLESIRHSKE
jgi:hypothetical protein